MEHLLFASVEASRVPAEFVTSTRFANVLFSDGSLTASFIARLAQRQPLAGPSDIRRYFISPRESALLCLLAACHEQSTQLLVPRMKESDLLSFNLLAERFLAAQGFQAKHYKENLAEAFANLEDDASRGEWPCVFTPSATSGEKPAEEFVEEGEPTADEQPYTEVLCLSAQTDLAWTTLGDVLDRLSRRLADPGWLRTADKHDLVEQLIQLVPSFQHLERGTNLDHVV
jgi:FlaA1/EpsC-like NDP-sugar epimerase